MALTQPLQLQPEYRDYVWGGHRLRPNRLTAEAWVVYAGDRIVSGPLAGRTLAEVAEQYGTELLGSRVVPQTGTMFPLLVKLLDCADWLSVQVHPNDEQAARLEGPGYCGKTEVWHILDATPGAQVIAGLKPGTTERALADAIQKGTVPDVAQYRPVHTGDTVFIPAGTIHALGPGLLIYEVSQTSDLTYRVFDWNRPQTANRVLHVDKSLAVANLDAVAKPEALPTLGDGDRRVVAQSQYFTIEIIAGETREVELDTAGHSFHALMAIEGKARITAGGASVTLNPLESALIPAASGKYSIQPLDNYKIFKASAGEASG